MNETKRISTISKLANKSKQGIPFNKEEKKWITKIKNILDNAPIDHGHECLLSKYYRTTQSVVSHGN